MKQLPWAQVGVEALAIVLNVLLALALDEWWQGREHDTRAAQVVQETACIPAGLPICRLR